MMREIDMEKDQKIKLKEEDLYYPVKHYLSELGFFVKSEVKNCDVIALKEGIILGVEMKLSLNLDVILQATIRQRVVDYVYIAIPKKNKILYTKRFKNLQYLLRRLEIGLLLVSFYNDNFKVEEYLKPKPFSRDKSMRLSNKKRNGLVKEFNERSGDFNIGGSVRKKLVTAYREKAIHIMALLIEHESLSIKELKRLGTDKEKTSKILQDNHYGWYKRISRGVYILSDKGISESKQYKELLDFYSIKKEI